MNTAKYRNFSLQQQTFHGVKCTRDQDDAIGQSIVSHVAR